MTNTRLNKLKRLYKTTSLFAIALVIGVTSLSTLITPQAMAYPGELDTSFNMGGSGFNNAVFSGALQSDNKMIIGGAFTTFNGSA